MEGLTVVPGHLAAPGRRFAFNGPNQGDECDGCPVKRLCFDLQPGTTYRVAEVRAVEHPCKLHDGDKVRVVRVVPDTVQTTAETKRLRGTAITWKPVDCGYPECPNWKLCHPTGPARDVRYAVEKEGAKVDCPMNYDIRRITMRRA